MTDDISVSFKIGGTNNYDQDLLNFKGSTGEGVAARLIEFFHLGSSADVLSPFEVFLEAQHVARATHAASKGLGAKPVKPEVVTVASTQEAFKPANVEPAQRTPTANGAGFTAPVVEQPHALLIASIDSAADEARLFALARENKTVWSGDVRAAADKRLAELRSA